LTVGVTQAPGRFGTDPDVDAPRLTRGERVYAALLVAYPRAFRARYGEEMVLLFGDQLRDARTAGGAGGVFTTWVRTFFDLLSSAVGEHLRKDRDMAQSLATFEPTRSMRWLGLLAVVGGCLLIGVFFWTGLFAGPDNLVRLVLFALSGAAVGLAFHRRHSAVAPRLALVATGGVVLAGLWYATSNIFSLNGPRSWAGVGGLIFSLSSLSLWLSAAVFGAISLRIGAAWRGMTRWFAATARMALLILVIGGPLAALGDDRWGLTHNETYGALITQATLLGVFLTGAGWALLGTLLVSGGTGTGPERRGGAAPEPDPLPLRRGRRQAP
jgi:hypothetical protein